MENALRPFFDGAYAPHGYCLLWQPALIWTHVVADALIALAYFSIPIALIMLVRRRGDIMFSWIFWLFALFITACGLTHVMSIWTLWNGNYGAEAILKVITALASVATAAVLWPWLPRLIALPSPRALADTIAERDAALASARAEMAQREKAEAALVQAKKLEALGQLTGGIAHDFNNILQAIGGNLELIERRREDGDRVARWSQNAQKAVEHGKSLSGQMLAFSRVQKLAISSVRLAPLIDGMRDLVQGSIGPTNRLEIAPPDPALAVMSDPSQLELSILNLAINARDAMPRGGELWVQTIARSGKVHADLPPGDYVEIAVRDTGVGMFPEVLERALEPFFTTKTVGEGAGLGLSMVFGVVRQSGGAVSIASKPGQGTTVSLILPRATIDPANPPALHDREPPARDALAGRTILLIDDDARVREAISEALLEAGAQVVSAAGGASGLQKLKRTQPDLIVADFAMPDMNGAEVAALARATHPDMPVLIVTGHSDSAELEQVIGPGIEILVKPFRSVALVRAALRLMAVGRG